MGKRTNTAVWMEKYSRWQIKVQKDGERKTFYSSTPGRKGQREANTKADAWMDDGILKDRIKVSVAYNDFLTYKVGTISRGHYSNYESQGRIHILPVIGNKQVSSLNEVDIQKVINQAYKKGLSRKTLQDIRGTLSAFLHYLRSKKIIKLTTENITIPRNAPVKEKRILYPKYINVLFSKDDTTYRNGVVKDWYINAYRFYVAMGLRRGELCAMLKSEQPQRAMRITGSINKFNELTEGKTENTQRAPILTPLAQKILDDQYRMLSAAGISSLYVFPDEFGDRTDPNRLYKRWMAYQKHHDFDPTVSLHELRHTWMSICKMKVPEARMKPIAGHSASMPSFDIYGHVVDGELEATANLMQSAFDEVIHDGFIS